MSLQITYPFTTAENYTYNTLLIGVSGGKAQLILSDNTGETYNQPFTSDSGFTYDNIKAEFTGGLVQQIDNLPTDGITWATYTSSVNLNYIASGSVIPILTGAPTIVGNQLDCTGETDRNAIYTNTNIGTIQDTGAVKLKWTPDYSGSPSTNTGIWEIGRTDNNKILLMHHTNGYLRVTARDSTGNLIHTAAQIGTFSPTSGVTYEFELNWTASTGVIELYVDGTYLGATPITTYTRTGSNVLSVGAGDDYPISDAFYGDVLLFDAVQHSGGAGGDYTAGYTLAEFRYVESSITLPDFTYSGLGTTQAFTAFATTDTNTPKYIINDEYWNGSAWVSSDGSFAQASSESVVNTNIASVPVADEVIIKTIFEDSNTIQMSTNDLTLTYTGQIYSTANPKIVPNAGVNSDGLIAFTSTLTEVGSDTVTFTISVDGTQMYWDGDSWETSAGFAESNTAADINTNAATLDLSAGTTIIPVAYLHSDDGSTTPNIDIIDMTYNYFNPPDDALSICHVSGYLVNSFNQAIDGALIEANIQGTEGGFGLVKNYWASKNKVSTNSNSAGYFEMDLVRSTELQGTVAYTFTITQDPTDPDIRKRNIVPNRIIPDSETVDFIDLVNTE